MKRKNGKKLLAKCWIEVKKSYVCYIFLLPVILGLLIFTISPIIQSFYFSLFDYDFMYNMEFIGLDNYKFIFTVEWESILQSFKATFIYAFFSVLVNISLSYLLAYFLSKKYYGVGLLRVLIYLPCIIPPIASSLLWLDIFDVDFGILNQLLTNIGLPKCQWLESADTAMFTLIFMGLWSLGGGMVLWLAAFKNIDATLYEAADLDGASALRKFFVLTVPMTTPMIFYNLIVGLVGGLQVFGSFLMTADGKGPEGTLYFMAVRIFKESFEKFNFGYASALAWVLFAVIAILSFILFKTNKWVFVGKDN